MRFRLVATLAAAAAMAVVSTVGASGAIGHGAPRPVSTASLRLGTRTLGEVYVYPGSPPRLYLRVDGARAKGSVTCEALSAKGTVTVLGAFPLRDGGGSWGTVLPSGPGGGNPPKALELVDSSGRVVASAGF